MTVATFTPHPPTQRLTEDAPLLARAGAFLLLLCLPLMLVSLTDTRLADGTIAGRNPLETAAALGLYLLTLAWSARFLPPRLRHAGWMRRLDRIVVAAAAAEFAWVASVAALGLRAQADAAAPIVAAIAPAMGLLALVLTSGALIRGALLLRHGWGEIERAAGWAFVATFVLTVPIAMALSAAPVEGPGLPPFGWTLMPGDLRPAHLAAFHAMQIVPLAALALSALGRLPYGTGAAMTALWSAATLALAAYGMGWTGLPPLL
ncbi:hypothetical protein [Jannaschia ovalis]|uniref:Uncharacterized protein n=1 Tax=Jannaschia ovalis TaxID=3038773 RepID=A0ABY8LDP2_9RHOB|nr:hypothetical protein [Jannaschia sp. GRR-S6-38]WGH78405.1 hypothetical protein P8627_15490 [Jannaschia sp. GRR-S6-38]